MVEIDRSIEFACHRQRPRRNTAPDCPRDFDMFVVEGGLRIEDEVDPYEPARGDFIERAVGVLHFSFETQKLRPRSDADIIAIHCNGIPDKCEASSVSWNKGPETGMAVSEIQDDLAVGTANSSSCTIRSLGIITRGMVVKTALIDV